MKRAACILLIIAVIFSAPLLVKNVHAQTYIESDLTIGSDTEWTTAQSPITFNETVIVEDNATLTIDPGVTVNFDGFPMFVYGTLIAQGNANSKITFSGYGNESVVGSVTSIIFIPEGSANDTFSVSESIIQNAVFSGVDVDVDSGMSAEIDSCVFNDTTPYADVVNIQTSAAVTLSNNVINCNVQTVQYGANLVDVYSGSPTITNNQFEGSFTGSGTDVAISVDDGSSPTISGNTFAASYNNNSYAIKVMSTANPQITGNHFDGGGSLVGVDDLSDSAVTVSNNVFTDCFSGVTAESGSIMTIQGNQFLQGTDGIDIYSSATVTVTDNLIDSNSRYGINGGGTITSNTVSNNYIGINNPTSGSISENNIVGNTKNSITTAVQDVDAENNWWGTTDTALINQTIYDKKVDPHLGTVTFVPFLTQPSASAPAIPNGTPTITPAPTQQNTAPQTTASEPTTTPDQYSQTFEYQVGSMINLNFITTTTAVILILAWVVVILGYVAKRGLSKLKSKDSKR